jgi:hypothetical protein
MKTMKRFTLMATALFCCLILPGCYRVSYDLELPVSAENQSKQTGPGKVSFMTTLVVHHFVFGLVSPSSVDLKNAIAREIGSTSGTVLKNISIKLEHSFLAGLLGVLTLGLWTPTTAIIEGNLQTKSPKNLTERNAAPTKK